MEVTRPRLVRTPASSWSNDDRHPKEDRATGPDELGCRPGLATSLSPVIDKQDPISGAYNTLHSQDGARSPSIRARAVVLPDRDEADAKGYRAGTAEQEAARLDANDVRNTGVAPRISKALDHRPETLCIGEDVPDVSVASLPAEMADYGRAGDTAAVTARQ